MFDPSIRRSWSSLRYAGRNNLLDIRFIPVEHALSLAPKSPQLWLRRRAFLRRYQYGLKIWDAYRPVAVQAKLWEASHNSDYVANPEIGVGSLHSWGIAVDATLVDSWNRHVRMPTDFDDFTPAAMWPYMGPSFEVRGHVRLLQYAMHRLVFADCAPNGGISRSLTGKNILPPEKAKSAAQVQGTQWNGKL